MTISLLPRFVMITSVVQATVLARHEFVGPLDVVVVVVGVVEVTELEVVGQAIYDVSHSVTACLFPSRKIMSTVEQETVALRHELAETDGVEVL